MPLNSNELDIEKQVELIKVHPATYDCTRMDQGGPHGHAEDRQNLARCRQVNDQAPIF